MDRARQLVAELSNKRKDLAVLEHQAHRDKVITFLQNRDAKTVKEMEFLGEAAAIPLHQDILLLRAEVRSLEDELRILLAWPDQQTSSM